MDQGSFEGVGGLKIFTRSWHPATTPRAVIVIVHGFNSHSGYYQWVAEQFVNNGLAVYALDLRGRGQSDGERFYVAMERTALSGRLEQSPVVRSQSPVVLWRMLCNAEHRSY